MPTFFVVLISIYLAGNIYIFRRGAQALVAQPFGVKVLLAVLFWCGALAFIGSFLARNTKLPVVLAHTAHEIGTGWGGFSPFFGCLSSLYGIMPNHIRFIPTFQLSMQIWFLYILISDT